MTFDHVKNCQIVQSKASYRGSLATICYTCIYLLKFVFLITKY